MVKINIIKTEEEEDDENKIRKNGLFTLPVEL